MFAKIIAVILGVILGFSLIAAFCLALAWPFMWMWNYAVVKALTVSSPIEYWPAFWLMLFISAFCIGAKTSGSSKLSWPSSD
tara:strand:+ start:321 stop:566 length:246 start_codon:yes stop_codon:yes gene_type:complete